ncbi:winged helix-turn-helix domain-containing tetratricopeptide repeat protein [Maliponia aquimaris]|uniref:Transcriptional activator CadC n=1 Tax=Maliponia aquimaris TaxID=1673631 RepID=A0A238JZM8_9RHOB|nr:winged helix-turn-helix domain-containing protein [Maliponia aquimaris]SMX36101.1 Transcriptional activator CadC [Maliponia aquimaris]
MTAPGAGAELRPTTAALLAYLETRMGETVSKSDLMDALWPDTHVTENSLYQVVSELRRALADRPGLELKTVPRRGYRLVRSHGTVRGAPWGWFPDVHRRGLRVVAAALVVMAVLAGVALVLARPRPEVLSIPPSIAVIPFEAMDDDPKWTRLGTGLSAEIAGTLARNSWLYVTAPATAETARDLPEAQVGRHLGVRFVLDGSIQTEGDALRVHATLRDDATARVVWTRRWDRPADHLFDIQDEIVTAIDAQFSSVYSGTLAEYGKARARKRPTSDLDAFDYFLLGSDEKHKFTEEGYDNALVYLRRAVVLDPNYAQAWITLSLVLGFQADMASPEVAVGLRDRQMTTALKAYALDPDDASVNWGMALAVTLAQGDRARGARHLRRALDLAPNDADVLLIAGWIAPTVGIFGPEPLAWADRSAVLNPSAPAWHTIGHGVAAFASGQYARSLEILAEAPESVETLLYRALALAQLGRVDEARPVRHALLVLAPDFSLEALHGPIPPGSDALAPLTEPARRLDIPIRLAEVAGRISPPPASAAASSDRTP